MEFKAKDGSFQLVDGIKFTRESNLWRGGKLGGAFRDNSGSNKTEYPYRRGITVYRSFDSAARASIKDARREYEQAKKTVTDYEAALASHSVNES